MTYRNLAEVLRRQGERLGARPAVRFKRYGLYGDLTWEQYRADALACAAALADAGIGPGDRVGLVSENRLEWLVADMGILTAGAVTVSPHAPLTARQIHFQLADAGARWLFVSNRDQREKIGQVEADLPDLRGVVAFEDAAADGRVISWAAFLQRGRAALPRFREELHRRELSLGTDDLATLMYTSGTTGQPKGVMLTHGNLVSNAAACDEASPRGWDAVLLAWLPFSHIYARTVDHYLSLLAGATLCLAESADTVVQNLEEVQPTHMSSVPRLYEKVLAAVASSDVSKSRRRLREIFGPRMDWLGSGGAPLPPAVAEAYRAAGLLVLQGYGLTESSPVISFNRKSHFKLETVGQLLPGVEVRIAPDGEVLSRGPHVMKGYWHNPQATAEAIRAGWLHTGDLGELDADGFLKITGRKKDLLVLSNGKKVVPAHLEGLLLGDDCIDQAVIHGEGRSYLTALIVPNWSNVRRTLQEAGESVERENDESLARHPAVLELLRRRVDRALADVSSWEQVKKFHVLARPFSVASEEMTVSLKLRRNVVLEKHGAALDALYREP
jgi:long-chain acyl-CoA synthetase